MSEIDDRALCMPTIEKRFEWIREYLERDDYGGVVSMADTILAMNPTDPQREKAVRLRARAKRAASVLGVKPAPVVPTWR